METWLPFLLLLLTSLFTSLLLKPVLLSHLPTNNLPPGPTNVPIISSLLSLLQPFSDLESIIRKLQARYGPIITLQIGSRPAIFISNRSLAHQALIQNGALFADRPPPLAINRIMSSNQHTVSSAVYGPMWRLLRRNLTSQILHPSRVKSYCQARKWVLDILSNRLSVSQSQSNQIKVIDHFQYAMFCLLVLMCFGHKLDEIQINQIKEVQQRLWLSFGQFNVLNFWPSFTKLVLKKRWQQFFQLRKDQADVLLPLIRARKHVKLNKNDTYVLSYVDTLWDLELPEEKRKLTEDEIISLCSEFLNAGTDTTSTALQWIMANLVKYPTIQEKLVAEIRGIVEETEEEEVKEEDLQNMPYLKAVVLEGLRRHPPAHFVVPHAVTHDFVFDGYMVPKNAMVNFMVVDMGWDAEVWKDPMDFKPERFLKGGEGEGFDVTGSREIRMMPFGAGRRICPALGLAMLHLEYFVANLVWRFEWKAVDGDYVDLSEKQAFTVLMKNPLQANISQRMNKGMHGTVIRTKQNN